MMMCESKVKVNLCLCVTKYHTMKKYPMLKQVLLREVNGAWSTWLRNLHILWFTMKEWGVPSVVTIQLT